MLNTRGIERTVNIMIVALLVGVVLIAGVQLRREHSVSRAEQILERQRGAFDRHDSLHPHDPRGPDMTAPARALVPLALARALGAEHETDPDKRKAALMQAGAMIATALERRPHWGEAEVVQAYILTQQQGPHATATLRAFARSYVDAPYLFDAALWRIGFGFTNWDSLGPYVRARLIDEAIWYVRLRPDLRPDLFALVRGSGAYVPFLLRWREMRSRDDDVRRLR